MKTESGDAVNDVGVIFDMDGVLVLTEQAHWESWLVPAGRRGAKLDFEKFKSCFGRVNPDCIPILFGPQVPAEDSLAIADEKEKAFRDIVRAKVPLAPGIKQFLTELKQLGARLAVGSSGPRENVELVVNSGGLTEYFDVLVDGSQVERGKPAPDCFLTASKRMGIAAGACAVIEDAPVGVRAAVAAGMLAIGVTTTHSKDDLKQAGAHQIFATPSEIPAKVLMSQLRQGGGGRVAIG
jgi:HAD superfamily hydrolase (TIGR01509 family)